MTHHDMLKRMYYAQAQEGIPIKGLVFHASLDGQTPAKAETGQTIATNGTAVYGTYKGIPCLQHTNNTNCWLDVSGTFSTTAGWTVSAWLAYADAPKNGETWCFGMVHNNQWGKCMLLNYNTSNWTLGVVRGGTGYTVVGTYTPPATAQWIHVAGIVDFSARTANVYLNGNRFATVASAVDGYQTSYNYVRFCTDYSGASRGPRGTYKMAGCRIYNRALKETEIQRLAQEFEPTA